jgi:hypothetical protein
MLMIRRLLPFAFLLLASALPAAADTMTYFMRNAHWRGVVVELFGEDTGTRWPGNDKVYLLEKGERKSVPIECRAGENICYGAWENGNDRTLWGVGPDNDRACRTCCAICVGKTTAEITIE